MTKGDRRNFKLFARLQDGDKKYVQLFDAIDRQSEYNEADLLEQFKGERFTRQFSVAKNYLYNYILKTLHVFHKDQYSELSTLMHQIQILMGKNLYEQAAKMVRKAKHLAERQERFQEILYLLEYERAILHRTVQTKKFEAFLQSIQEKENSVVAQLENLLKLNHLYDEIYLLMNKTNVARGSEDRAQVDRILKNPLLQDGENALSVRGRLKMLDILVDSYKFKNDHPKCLVYLNEMVNVFESHPDIRLEKNIRYINTVSNFGVLNYYLGNTKEALRILGKLKDLETFNQQELLRVFEKYYHFKLALCIEMCDVEEGKRTIAEFTKEYKQVEGKITKAVELGIFHLLAYFHFQDGNPSEALNWINLILNEPKTELRTDIQCMARIMNLIIHYELGNKDFVEYNLKSTARFLTNRGRMFSFERLILKYLRQLILSTPGSSDVALLSRFRAEMDEVLDDPAEKKGLNLLDIVVWVESKLENRTMFQYQNALVNSPKLQD